MKKIIKNKVYDTETARFIGSYDNGVDHRDIYSMTETLYRKRTGEYFLHGAGGPGSRYSARIDSNNWSGGEDIIPLTYDQASEWAEEHLDADEYEQEFGAVTEDESAETVTISLPAAVIAKIRRQAQEQGSSVSAVISSALNPKYIIRDREAGNYICTCDSIDEAVRTLAQYEADDKRDGSYTENFYEIVEA
jgi:hypothetical protein